MATFVAQFLEARYLSDAWHDANGQGKEGNQVTKALILTLFSFSNPDLSIILDNVPGGVFKRSYGEVLLFFYSLRSHILQNKVHFE